jgi:hypothetical protein
MGIHGPDTPEGRIFASALVQILSTFCRVPWHSSRRWPEWGIRAVVFDHKTCRVFLLAEDLPEGRSGAEPQQDGSGC